MGHTVSTNMDDSPFTSGSSTSYQSRAGGSGSGRTTHGLAGPGLGIGNASSQDFLLDESIDFAGETSGSNMSALERDDGPYMQRPSNQDHKGKGRMMDGSDAPQEQSAGSRRS